MSVSLLCVLCALNRTRTFRTSFSKAIGTKSLFKQRFFEENYAKGQGCYIQPFFSTSASFTALHFSSIFDMRKFYNIHITDNFFPTLPPYKLLGKNVELKLEEGRKYFNCSQYTILRVQIEHVKQCTNSPIFKLLVVSDSFIIITNLVAVLYSLKTK